MPERVEVFTSEKCYYCNVLKKRLNQLGVKFKEINVDTKEGLMLATVNNIMHLPTLKINDKFLVGLPPTEKLIKFLEENNGINRKTI
jgi:glutaredoxin